MITDDRHTYCKTDSDLSYVRTRIRRGAHLFFYIVGGLVSTGKNNQEICPKDRNEEVNNWF